MLAEITNHGSGKQPLAQFLIGQFFGGLIE